MKRLAMATAIVGLLAAPGCGDDDDDARGVPEISIPALGEGAALDVGALEGPAVVNFWATWCEPCLRELPDFQRASEDFPDVRFLGIDATGFGEDDASVDFVAGLGVTYEQFVDADGKASAEFEVTQMPATFVVDVDGDIAWSRQGEVSYDQLADHLADL